MTVDLRRALGELADQTPPTLGVTTTGYGIYRRATRANVRLGLLAMFVVALVLVGSISSFLSLRTDPAPAAPPFDPRTTAIPNATWTPSPWTPGTAASGPIGPLALVSDAPRHTSWFHTDRPATYGVSASTGTTRFLDLPGAAPSDRAEVTLSPSGRYVGYFIAGAPSGAAQPGAIVGFASYDTVTGRSTVDRVATVHGIDPQQLVWTGDSSSLVAVFAQWAHASDQGLGFGAVPQALEPSSGRVTRVPELGEFAQVVGPIAGGISIFVGSRQLPRVLDPLTGASHALPAGQLLPGLYPQTEFTSPDGRLVAANGGDFHLYVGSARIGAQPGWQQIYTPGTHPVVLAGWLDETHLLYAAWSQHFGAGPGVGDSNPGPAWYTVDVTTGDVKPAGFTSHATSDDWNIPQFATNLLTRPFVPAHQPPFRLDPRVIPGVAAALLALIAIGALCRWLGLMNERRRLLRAERKAVESQA